MTPDEVIKPDAHLRTALRHAPDANDAAPADISAQIIAAAHRSAGERPAPPVRQPRARGRWWLQPWSASGALATVLMAGVTSLMWRGETPGPARDAAGPQVAQAPDSTPAAASPPASAETTNATASAPAPAVAAIAPQPAKPSPLAAAPAARPAPKPSLQAMTPEPGETMAAAREAAPPAGPRAAETAPRLVAQDQPAAAAPAAVAAPAPAPAAAATSRLRATAGAAAVAQAPWRAEPQAGDQFSWQPAGRLMAPDAAWLARLAEQTAGRWQPLPDAPAAQLSAEVAPLHWQRSGATVARFGFDRSSVWWCGSVAACERAPLDASAARDLLGQLAR